MWKKIAVGAFAIGVTVIGGGLGYLHMMQPEALPAESVQVAMTPEAIARGEYIFTVLADCDGCHSQRDFTRFSSPVVAGGRGKGFVFPPELGLPGKVVARNITPDVETGLGAWTDGEKIRAIREGISRDGTALFAMMPFETYRNMSDADVQAVVAYMNTLPAIKNPMPRSELDFPVNYLMKSAPKPARGIAAPSQADQLAYGKYLVQMAACGICHTKMDKGTPIAGMEFAGGEPFRIGTSIAVSANITPDLETGIGKWSEDYFVERFHQYRQYLQSGPPKVGPEGFTVMPWVSFSKISREELLAIRAYLMTQKPVVNAVETHPGKP